MSADRKTLLFVAALAFGSVAAPAQSARAQSDRPAAHREAGEHFRKGVRFYLEGEHSSALIEFRRAHALLPDYRVLFNLGHTNRELKDYAAAIESFERYLAEGNKRVDPKRRLEVKALLKQLRTKVAALTIEVDVEGAELRVDDVAVGASPLAEPLTINAGRRKVTAQREGYVSTQRVVDLAGADQVNLRLELVPVPTTAVATTPAPVARRPAPTAPPPPPARSLWPWVGVVGTGALALTAGALGYQSLQAHSSLEDALGRRTSTSEVEDKRSKADSWALATDLVGGVALAGAVATVVLFVVTQPKRANATKARVGFDPGGLRLTF